MKIGIDLNGSDTGYSIFLEALQSYPNDSFVLFGDEIALKEFDSAKYEKVVCPETIIMEDGILSIKRKRKSSMAIMLDYLNENKIDCCLSAGSTAALLTLSYSKIPLVENTTKACLISAIPAKNDGYSYLCDMGANTEITAEELVQTGRLAKEYVKSFGVKEPKVGLLNIGAEEHKGDKLHQETNKLLKEAEDIRFIGNIEGRDIFDQRCDIILSDGFSGNIALKTMEGTAYFAMDLLKNMFKKHILCALIMKNELKGLKKSVDYTSYGGAYLLGFDRVIVKAHGSSSAKAIVSAIRQVIQIADTK